jgi:hypothetical protein
MKTDALLSTNRDVYLADEGVSLMQPDFFTDEILTFHSCEKIFCSRVTNEYDHRLVIEVGCSNFRLIDTKPEECHYLGVDINPPEGTRIPDKKGAIIRCDARRFFANSRIRGKIITLFGDRVACILPFNFLGTMDEPIRFLHHVSRWNKDIVLSLFNTTDRATEARISYYKKCGIVVEQVAKTEEFVRLNCSNGFEAFAFSQTYIESILTNSDYRLERQEVHDVFAFMFFRHQLNPRA